MNLLFCALKVKKNKLIMKPSPDTKVSCSFTEVLKDALNDTQSLTMICFPALQSKSESSVASVLCKC